MQACKLNLPHTRPSLDVASLVFEHSSNTLALMHTDSSILLLPSLSPFITHTPSLQSQTLIPPQTTSSCFLRLQQTPISSNPRVIFAVAGPGPNHSDPRLLLRFWILNRKLNHNPNRYVRSKVVCNHKDFVCDDKLGVFVGAVDDLDVKLVGDVNYFAMHLVSKKKIWIFAVKMVEKDVDDCVKLMKCGVIDCSIEVCSISLSSGFLFLGECNGVRVFPLRFIVKSGLKEQKNSTRKNGHSNDAVKEPADKSAKAKMNAEPLKHRTAKLKQDSSVGGGVLFVKFSLKEPCQKSSTNPLFSLRAVSVQSLYQKKFLVLDSDGDLHLLGLYSTASGSESIGHMKHMSHTMKVKMLAVLPDISSRTQTYWISDGISSVHVMSVSDMEIPASENDKSESVEKQMQISVIEAVFTGEKVQDLIPLSTNSILLLGQGNIFAYAIS